MLQDARCFLRPAQAHGIVGEVRGASAEEREVAERRACAEQVAVHLHVRAESLLPRLQRVVHPRLDVLGRGTEPHQARDHGFRGERSRAIEAGTCLVLRLARDVEAAGRHVLVVEPARPDGMPVEPLVGEVVEQEVEESEHRVGGLHRVLGQARLEVHDDRRRVPDHLALGRRHHRDAAVPAEQARLGVHAEARPQPPRLALVVEVARDLAREVRHAQAVHDVALTRDRGLRRRERGRHRTTMARKPQSTSTRVPAAITESRTPRMRARVRSAIVVNRDDGGIDSGSCTRM